MRRVFGDEYLGAPMARISSSGTVAWYQTDRLGSVASMTDGAGVLRDTINYDGYGKIVSESDSSFGDRYKFTGRERDSITGLQLHDWRQYDPVTGTWTSRDPIGFAAGDANLYRYVGNNSLNAVDPEGLELQTRPLPIDGGRRWGIEVRTSDGGHVGWIVYIQGQPWVGRSVPGFGAMFLPLSQIELSPRTFQGAGSQDDHARMDDYFKKNNAKNPNDADKHQKAINCEGERAVGGQAGAGPGAAGNDVAAWEHDLRLMIIKMQKTILAQVLAALLAEVGGQVVYELFKRYGAKLVGKVLVNSQTGRALSKVERESLEHALKKELEAAKIRNAARRGVAPNVGSGTGGTGLPKRGGAPNGGITPGGKPASGSGAPAAVGGGNSGGASASAGGGSGAGGTPKPNPPNSPQSAGAGNSGTKPPNGPTKGTPAGECPRLTDQEALRQALKVRQAKVSPKDLRGATHGPTGQPGHAMPKHGMSNERIAEIINGAERRFVGINEHGRRVNIFVRGGDVVITEADDVTRVITAYGRSGVNKLPGGRVVPGKAVEPSKWASDPSYHEVID